MFVPFLPAENAEVVDADIVLDPEGYDTDNEGENSAAAVAEWADIKAKVMPASDAATLYILDRHDVSSSGPFIG